ncbi:hypothetical protein KR49_05855 [Synechococcus sp. KORDI-49]|nr:hypothetical protein KR49_05850 [Synechococcus sp. KORDI-49]AII45977.1 hypothetical protein KR49_05855 [Synechococcus sp. KORDI-49]
MEQEEILMSCRRDWWRMTRLVWLLRAGLRQMACLPMTQKVIHMKERLLLPLT